MADADNQQQNQNESNSNNNSDEKTFSAPYVRELREENKSYRLKSQELENQLKTAREEAELAKKQIEETSAKLSQSANERVIKAELKALAIAEGMHDLDGLKLADLSGVKLDENGNVVGGAELMAKLKESKPYLFKKPDSSSAIPGKPPKAEADGKKRAIDMTPEEYAKHKARVLKGIN